MDNYRMHDSVMQQQASNGGVSSGLQQNGAKADSGGPHANGNLLPESDSNINGVNGDINQSLGPPKIMDKTNQDIARLIGQHSKTVGLDRTADLLMQESGCRLDHPAAAKFRQHVMDGDWNKADHDHELKSFLNSANQSLVIPKPGCSARKRARKRGGKRIRSKKQRLQQEKGLDQNDPGMKNKFVFRERLQESMAEQNKLHGKKLQNSKYELLRTQNQRENNVVDITSDSDDDRDYYYNDASDLNDVSIIDKNRAAPVNKKIQDGFRLNNNVRNDVTYTKTVSGMKRRARLQSPKSGYSKDSDDTFPKPVDGVHNLDELKKDARLIHALLPRFSFSLIYTTLCSNQFARNCTELTLWDLLERERPRPETVSQPKLWDDLARTATVIFALLNGTSLTYPAIYANIHINNFARNYIELTLWDLLRKKARPQPEYFRKQKSLVECKKSSNVSLQKDDTETAVGKKEQSPKSGYSKDSDDTFPKPVDGVHNLDELKKDARLIHALLPRFSLSLIYRTLYSNQFARNCTELTLWDLLEWERPSQSLVSQPKSLEDLNKNAIIIYALLSKISSISYRRIYVHLKSLNHLENLYELTLWDFLRSQRNERPEPQYFQKRKFFDLYTVECKKSSNVSLQKDDIETAVGKKEQHVNKNVPECTAVSNDTNNINQQNAMQVEKTMLHLKTLSIAAKYVAPNSNKSISKVGPKTEELQLIKNLEVKKKSKPLPDNTATCPVAPVLQPAKLTLETNFQRPSKNVEMHSKPEHFPFTNCRHEIYDEIRKVMSDDLVKDIEKNPDSKNIILNEKANALYVKLIPMVPNVKTHYIKQLCHDYTRDYERSLKQAEIFEHLVDMLLNCGSENLKKLKPFLPPKEEPGPSYDMNEQYANLLTIFPEADPVYLRKRAEEMHGDHERFKEFVDLKLENPDYPTRTQYLAKKRITEQQKQYTTDFKVQQFLEIFPDPFSHFENDKRNYEFNPHAIGFLKYYFSKLKLKTLVKAYYKYRNNLSLTAKAMEALNPDMKTKRRTDKIVLIEDIPFLQECAFIQHKAELRKYLDGIKTREEQEFNELKAKGQLIECQCCYDNECMPSKCSTCEEGHIFCNSCIIRSTDVVLGDGNTSVDCLLKCGCEFPISVLQRVLPPTKFSILLCKRQEAEVIAAGVEGLVSCPFCHFASIPPPEDKIFKCLNPECMKESCRLCKEINHIPLKCNEKKAESARKYLEERMTEALVRKCYRCSRMFFKEEGCNKMTCVCGAQICYICDKPVTDYKHFQGQGAERSNLCPLWSDDRRTNAESVIKVCQQTVKQFKEKDPKIDINVDALLPKLPPKNRGPHDYIY